MNKYLIKGMTLLAVCAGFASCSKDLTPMSQEEIDNLQALKVTKTYEQAFLNYVGGSIAEDQDWGFGSTSAASRMTRSQASPACPGIDVNATKSYAADILAKSIEVNSSNATFGNYDATTKIQKGQPGRYTGYDWTYIWGSEISQDEKDYFASLGYPGDLSNEARDYILSQGWTKMLIYEPGTEDEVVWNSNYVLNFKISSTWNGEISVMGNIGQKVVQYTINDNNTITVTESAYVEKTVYIDNGGKWIIPSGTSTNVGQGYVKDFTDAVIIVGNGGELQVNGTMNLANCARLIVLPGGSVTGTGSIQVNNGNISGSENYNGGTISVATFNNNFGKFYNYGNFLVNEYQGGAKESNFYNHNLAVIDHFAGTGSTANARIFNNCQFYVVNDARIRNYEGLNGSALIVGGQLMFSSSEDGTSTPTYVGLQQGALVKCATLYNNGTSWTGPTSGYAALEITDKIVYLNWQQDAPQTGGYFENNIYVKSATWDNVPDGNGYHQTDPSDAANYAVSIADYKFFSIVANCRGNNGVTKVTENSTEIFSASEDFVLGQSGCTPGFTGDITTPTPPPSEEEEEEDNPDTPNIRIIAEDLNANGSDNSDFDFNDVVIDVYFGDAGKAKAKIIAAGGTLDLRVDGQEVHELFGKANGNANYKGMMINTNGENSKYPGVKARSIDNRIQPVITLTKEVNSAEQARDNIEIEVYKNNTWIPLTAKKGEPASKIGVAPTYSYCDEREEISSKHTGFKDWVKGNGTLVWWE